jgi:putative redox protein
MDIIAILRKASKEVKDLNIKVIGELSKQQPVEYIAIHIIYDFKGDESCKEAALNAVNDSQEKYCGVSQMLKKALPITWEVKYNTTAIFNNRVVEKTISEN